MCTCGHYCTANNRPAARHLVLERRTRRVRILKGAIVSGPMARRVSPCMYAPSGSSSTEHDATRSTANGVAMVKVAVPPQDLYAVSDRHDRTGCALVEAEDEVAGSILGALDGVEHDTAVREREERVGRHGPGRRRGGQRGEEKERGVERGGLVGHAGVLEGAGVGHEGVVNAVGAHVGARVGVLRRAEQREAHQRAQRRVAILAVIQKRHTKAVFCSVASGETCIHKLCDCMEG